jgi:hypothetical protein
MTVAASSIIPENIVLSIGACKGREFQQVVLGQKCKSNDDKRCIPPLPLRDISPWGRKICRSN